MLTVVTPAQHYRLATLESVQAVLGLTDSATGEERLRSLIETVSDHLAEACERVFARQQYKQSFPGYGRPEFQLAQSPVESPIGTLTFRDETVDADTIELRDPKQGILYNSALFIDTSLRGGLEGDPRPGTEREDYLLDPFWAGYVLPDDLAKWAPAEPVEVGMFRKPTRRSSMLLFEVTAAGATGTTEPTWPTEVGESVVDGTATLTARMAYELPQGVQEACRQEVVARYLYGARDASVKSRKVEGVEFEYRDATTIGGSSGRFKGEDTEALIRPYSRAWL